MKKKDFEFKITNHTISAGNEIYNIKNLTKLSKYKENANNKERNYAIVFGIIIFISLITISQSEEISIFYYLIPITFIIFGIFFRKKPKYSLVLETSAASKSLFSSTNSKFIDKIISLVHSAMENQESSIDYTINLNDQSIINEITGSNIFGNVSQNARKA
nr:DUF6232 family protein [uncultured Cohaesibacter sp.]